MMTSLEPTTEKKEPICRAMVNQHNHRIKNESKRAYVYMGILSGELTILITDELTDEKIQYLLGPGQEFKTEEKR